MTLSDVLNVVNPTLVIGFFLWERYVDSRTRRGDLDIEAYYKVMYESGAKKIDEFIDKTVSLYDSYLQLYTPGNTISFPLPAGSSADTIRTFSEAKRMLELSVIKLFFLRYPNVAEEMTNAVLEVEDEFVIALDEVTNGQPAREIFMSKLYTTRTRFYHLLLTPVERPARARRYPWQKKLDG